MPMPSRRAPARDRRIPPRRTASDLFVHLEPVVHRVPPVVGVRCTVPVDPVACIPPGQPVASHGALHSPLRARSGRPGRPTTHGSTGRRRWMGRRCSILGRVSAPRLRRCVLGEARMRLSTIDRYIRAAFIATTSRLRRASHTTAASLAAEARSRIFSTPAPENKTQCATETGNAPRAPPAFWVFFHKLQIGERHAD